MKENRKTQMRKKRRHYSRMKKKRENKGKK